MITSKSLLNRRALITGASRGLGAAIAERFAREGAHVILISRDTKGLEEVDDRIQKEGGQATLVPLDLRQGDTIDSLAAHVFERFGGLDILIGNAGILGGLTPVPHLRPAVWDDIMAVNLTTNWRLLRAFDPLLRQSTAGRAIFVSSSSATEVVPYWGAYAASKCALEMLVKTYAEEVRNTYPSLKVNLVDPGHLRTSMGAEAMPGEDPSTLPHPSTVTDIFVRLASEECERIFLSALRVKSVRCMEV
jgi:NAD(P)-dependent dehydrogenase (short-subunit alcohol dehydrogenase family)